jgi:hypothetical protein
VLPERVFFVCIAITVNGFVGVLSRDPLELDFDLIDQTQQLRERGSLG